MGKKTLVIGASNHPWRYAFLVVNKLRQNGHEVIALGKEKGSIGDVPIESEQRAFNNIDTVTLYINPTVQSEYEDYILTGIKPKRIIFNPGTENSEFEELAEAKGIEVLEACTLVMLSTGEY